MEIEKAHKVAIAITLQIVIVGVMILYYASILAGGTPVTLHIQPVDPRDPLRGDYVTFQYDISEINSYYIQNNPNNGSTVYVPLRKSGKYWIVSAGVSTVKPDKGVFLKGVVVSGGGTARGPQGLSRTTAKLRVKYGLEEYFIPEGVGQNFSFREKNNYAVVVVDSNGNGVVKQIYVDDKPWP